MSSLLVAELGIATMVERLSALSTHQYGHQAIIPCTVCSHAFVVTKAPGHPFSASTARPDGVTEGVGHCVAKMWSLHATLTVAVSSSATAAITAIVMDRCLTNHTSPFTNLHVGSIQATITLHVSVPTA